MQTFPRHWPFGRGIHRSPVNSPHKGQWRGALMFSLICIWINSWVKNRDAGDLRRHLAHHDVTVMFYCIRRCQPCTYLYWTVRVVRFKQNDHVSVGLVQGDGRGAVVRGDDHIGIAARLQGKRFEYYNDVIMSPMASQITSLTIAYPSVYSGTYQRKHQSSASLAFVRGIHRWPVNSPHKGPVTRKMLPFDDVIMTVCTVYWKYIEYRPQWGIW